MLIGSLDNGTAVLIGSVHNGSDVLMLIRSQVYSLALLGMDLLVSQIVHFVIGSFKMAFNFSSCKALSVKGMHSNYT